MPIVRIFLTLTPPRNDAIEIEIMQSEERKSQRLLWETKPPEAREC